MPDISTINGVDITTLASFGGVAFADGQTLDGQNVALSTDAHTLIATSGAITSATTVDFTSGISSDYGAIEIRFLNVGVATDTTQLKFYINGGSDYSTTTSIDKQNHNIYYNEYINSRTLTTNNWITNLLGNDTGEVAGGILRIYEPASTGHLKLFQAVMPHHHSSSYTYHRFTGGHLEETNAITRVTIRAGTGSLNSGEIQMYGIKKS